MKIILLTQWFFPEPGPRVHELAEELVRRGHSVTVVTGFPTYPYDRFYDGYRPNLFRCEERNGVKVFRIPHFAHGRVSALRRVFNYCSFTLSAMIIGNALITRADCMYVFMPPPLIGLAALAISLIHRIPLMYDIQDIWPDAVEASSFRCSKVMKMAIRLMEKIVYPFAKAISVPSEGYKRNLVAKGVGEGLINVIPNWADESIYHPMPYDLAIAEKYNLESKFTVMFAGNLGYSQSLETVIDVATKLRDHKDIRFVFAGDGAALPLLQLMCEERCLQNVIFTGRLPVELMPSLFSVADIMIVHLKSHPAFRMTIPCKTQAYMACGKLILMAVEGDAAELVRRTNSGVTCCQENASEMADTIHHILFMKPEERRMMGENARKAFLTHFKKTDIVGRYEHLLYRVAGITDCKIY